MRLLLVLLLAASVGVVGAHAHLADSEPAADSLIAADAAPSVITLEFTEGVELAFSTFKLVRVEHELDVESETYSMRLNALAAQIASEALAVRGEVEGEIALDLQPARGTEEKFELRLEAPLAPGSYALIWRVLSVDTHIIEEFITFTVLP